MWLELITLLKNTAGLATASAVAGLVAGFWLGWYAHTLKWERDYHKRKNEEMQQKLDRQAIEIRQLSRDTTSLGTDTVLRSETQTTAPPTTRLDLTPNPPPPEVTPIMRRLETRPSATQTTASQFNAVFHGAPRSPPIIYR